MEVKRLELEIEHLKKELEYEKLKSVAYSTSIDVAENQFGIDIRNKLEPNSEYCCDRYVKEL